MQEDDEVDRSGGGVVDFFGGAGIGEETREKEKEEGGTQTDMLRLRRGHDTGCRPGRGDGRGWSQHEKQRN